MANTQVLGLQRLHTLSIQCGGLWSICSSEVARSALNSRVLPLEAEATRCIAPTGKKRWGSYCRRCSHCFYAKSRGGRTISWPEVTRSVHPLLWNNLLDVTSWSTLFYTSSSTFPHGQNLTTVKHTFRPKVSPTVPCESSFCTKLSRVYSTITTLQCDDGRILL